MGVLRHWLAFRDRWQDSPKVITPRDDDDVAEWRRLGYRVEGPFVPAEQLRGAVEDARDAGEASMQAAFWRARAIELGASGDEYRKAHPLGGQ